MALSSRNEDWAAIREPDADRIALGERAVDIAGDHEHVAGSGLDGKLKMTSDIGHLADQFPGRCWACRVSGG